jgi:hypothetical protein
MIQLAFAKPGDSPISKLIAGFDDPRRFCHVALRFEDGMVYEAHAETGVRFTDRVLEPDWYEVLEIPVPDGEDRTVRRFAELEAGCGYDFNGVLAIGRVPFLKADPEKYFCSELAVACLQKVGFFPELTPHKVSPNRLYLESQALLARVAEKPEVG